MAKHAREIDFRRITMAQNKTGQMRWMMNEWMQAAWAMMHGPSRENRESDTSNTSPPEAADRDKRAFTRMIMRLSIMMMNMILIHADQHQTMSSLVTDIN